MSKDLFQSKKLNPKDHKKEEDTAKNVRNGFLLAGFISLAVKEGPKLIKKVVNVITKV